MITCHAPCPVCGRAVLPARGESLALYARRKTCGLACREALRTQQAKARQGARLREAVAAYQPGMSMARLAQAYSLKPDDLRAALRDAGHAAEPAQPRTREAARRQRDDEPPPDYLLMALERVYGKRARVTAADMVVKRAA